MASQPFIHQPLNLNKHQIRLFRLIPTESDELLAGTVTVHYLKDCPLYKAVSYTWGSADQTREISLGGRSFTVRENLWQFLNTVRYETDSWLWIDQICIDQTAVEERNHQVNLMAKIYAKATEVLVWLGTEAHGSNEAMEAINSGAIRSSNKLKVKALFRRTYWDRLWVLQEVLMAQNITVLCGNKRFNWMRLEDLFVPHVSGTAAFWTSPVDINQVALSLIKERASFTGADQRLSYILEVFAGLQCEDVRDKVYGLLSLVRRSGLIPVDYSKSSADVFFNAIRRIVKDDISMDFGSHFDVGRHLREKMMLVDISDSEISICVEKELERYGVNQSMEGKFGQDLLLFWAAGRGQEAFFNYLLEKPVNLEIRDKHGQAQWFWAVCSGHEAVVKQLVEEGADLESETRYGQTPLCLAAKNGREAVVKYLLDQGANTESKNEYGQTPVFLAAENGHEAVVKHLLQKGANIEPEAGYGQTPLCLAVENGHEAVVKQLLEKGVNLEYKDWHGQTPLCLAVESGHEAVVKQLLEKGANVESKGKDGQTPLCLAIGSGHEVMIKHLLDKGANLESRNSYGQTPLCLAIESGHDSLVRHLLEKGANPESKANHGQTPLCLAAQNGHRVVVKYLLDQGANIESPNYSQTPLIWAAQNGHEEVVKYLHEKGADLESKDMYGQTPLAWAVKNGHEEVVKYLHEKVPI